MCPSTVNDHHGKLISVVIVHAIRNIHVVIIVVNSIDENSVLKPQAPWHEKMSNTLSQGIVNDTSNYRTLDVLILLSQLFLYGNCLAISTRLSILPTSIRVSLAVSTCNLTGL